MALYAPSPRRNMLFSALQGLIFTRGPRAGWGEGPARFKVLSIAVIRTESDINKSFNSFMSTGVELFVSLLPTSKIVGAGTETRLVSGSGRAASWKLVSGSGPAELSRFLVTWKGGVIRDESHGGERITRRLIQALDCLPRVPEDYSYCSVALGFWREYLWNSTLCRQWTWSRRWTLGEGDAGPRRHSCRP